MAIRPVFLPSFAGTQLVTVRKVTFEWHPGLSFAQKRRSVHSLHAAYHLIDPTSHILEVSRASEMNLGKALSAFNLRVSIPDWDVPRPVECVFQSSKVFERGGPYLDLLDVHPIEAKTDSRLKDSGRLIGFCYLNESWPTMPQTAFYDWIYLTALHEHPNLTGR